MNINEIEFDEQDLWDYTTLGELMIKWLEAFKERGKQGCPCEYLENKTTAYTEDDIEKGLQAFYKDIDDLIWALGDPEVDQSLPYNEWIKEAEILEKRKMEKLQLFPKLYYLLWR